MTTLVWFRNDLRVDDHAPLDRAAARGPVVCVYCFDPRDWQRTSFGFPKTGSYRTQFLIESVEDLRARLRELGSDLLVRVGKPEEELPRIAGATGATRLHYHAEVTSEETKVERNVLRNLDGVRSQSFWGHTLLDPESLPFSTREVPDVFTRFRRIVERESEPPPPVPAPSRLEPAATAAPSGDLPSLDELGIDEATSDPRAVLAFEGGETAGRARMDAYFWQRDCLREYKETRNGMLGEDYSSKLSPWLARGCLSSRRIAAEVARYEQERVRNDSTYWLVFELLWRDYFRFVAAKYGRSIFYPSGIQGIDVPWSRDRSLFQAWAEGRTGVPLVDANMRELALTGFQSNRGRQIVASYLTKNLGIDWRMGAEWFESLLVDYDVTSNYGNWNYAAGVGNDARGFRYFHIPKQARTYDPEGAYVKHWLPELSPLPTDKVHAPHRLNPDDQVRYDFTLGDTYPRPVVDLDHSVQTQKRRFEAALGISSEDGVRGRRRRCP